MRCFATCPEMTTCNCHAEQSEASVTINATNVQSEREEESPMPKDPVCNMNVDEKKSAATSIYKGKTYYFCAKVCKEKFDKEPEKFIAKEKE